MAEKLPKYTWSAEVLTLKGTKKVVYSTVTGDVVGEIRDGKFVQTVKSIPQPTVKKPITVTVPETARAGGIENTIASFERDAAYYKMVAEDINKPASDRADARDEYNRLQGEIAKLQGEREQFTQAEKKKTEASAKVDARTEFDKLKTEYQDINKKFNALINPNTDPKGAQYQARMYELVNKSLPLYKQFSGSDISVSDVTKLLSGATTPSVSGAPTGTMTPVISAGPTGTAVPQGQQTAKTPKGKPSKTPGKPATGTMPEMPAGGTTGVAGAGFNPAAVRAGEGASMGAAKPAGFAGPTDLQTLLKKTEFWYDLPDYLFQTVPGLGDILVKAVNEGWDNNKFLAAAKLTPWWQSTSGVLRQRITDKAKYDELKAQGQDVSKSDYGQYLSKQIRNVKAQAKTIAGVTLDDAQAQQIAEKIYNGNLDDDPLAINRLIIPFIGKVTDRYAGTDVTTYGGQALNNYQMLQSIAKSNGLNLKDILPQISTSLTGGDLEKAVLQGLASGDIDVNRIAQNARIVAAQGQPEYVRNLLNQGYDLEQIYAPYKKTMATVLELDPNQIDVNDPTLRSAINNNGDMNVYDFKKALRKDARWQYTENARNEMTDSAFTLLRNFGFMG